MITTDDAERAVAWLRDNAERIGEARAQRAYLEQWIKTVRAELMVAQAGMSNAAAETIALASPKYLAALQAYKEAIKQDETLRFLAVAAEAKVAAWQTQSANDRVINRV